MKLKQKMFEVFKNNSEEFNMLKTIEELQELSLILTQYYNKPGKVPNSKVEEEIAHVKIRLNYLQNRFSKPIIKKQMKKKINHLYKKICY